MSRSTATTGRDRRISRRFARLSSVSDVGGLQCPVEHRGQGGGDICVSTGLEITARRCAVLKTGFNIGDIGVRDTSSLLKTAVGFWICSWGNIEHGYYDTAILEGLAVGRGARGYHRGAVASRKAQQV